MSVCLRNGFLRNTYIACLGILVAGLWFVPHEPTLAQALTIEDDSSQGRVTIQGGPLETIEVIEEDVIESIDYKEEMRLFIQDISQFSRNYNPNFVVIVENALELLTKTDFTNEELVLPARTYTRSIDGVMEVGLFHGTPYFGEPHDNPKVQEAQLGYAKQAKKESLRVLIVDKADQPEVIEAGRELSLSHKFIYGSIPSTDIESAILPAYPKRPFNENSKSVLSMANVKNFAIIGNSAAYGREDEFALQMHTTNYDMLIVDMFHGRKPLSKEAVNTLKYKQTGTKRLVMARMNIGTAAKYHYYWKNSWMPGFPSWIGAPMRQDPDRYFVKYWTPQWKRIITGDTQSFLYGVIAQGFDGVILSDADVYDVYIAGGESELENN